MLGTANDLQWRVGISALLFVAAKGFFDVRENNRCRDTYDFIGTG